MNIVPLSLKGYQRSKQAQCYAEQYFCEETYAKVFYQYYYLFSQKLYFLCGTRIKWVRKTHELPEDRAVLMFMFCRLTRRKVELPEAFLHADTVHILIASHRAPAVILASTRYDGLAVQNLLSSETYMFREEEAFVSLTLRGQTSFSIVPPSRQDLVRYRFPVLSDEALFYDQPCSDHTGPYILVRNISLLQQHFRS